VSTRVFTVRVIESPDLRIEVEVTERGNVTMGDEEMTPEVARAVASMLLLAAGDAEAFAKELPLRGDAP
jgi:hypothetical protein